jgi:alpha-beta hydrolase superfamily lysophospholipase
MHRQEHVVDGVFGYRFAGDEPSHAVLVCHGMGGHGGIYDVFGEAYARVGAEVWCIDLPGCGRSTSTRRPGSFTVAEWVDATVGYAAHIRAATRLPVVVLGSSLGVMPAAAALGANDDIVAAVLMGFAVAGLPGQEPHPFRSEAGQAILAQVGTTAAVKIDRLVDFDADYGYPGAGEAKRRDPSTPGSSTSRRTPRSTPTTRSPRPPTTPNPCCSPWARTTRCHRPPSSARSPTCSADRSRSSSSPRASTS